VKSPVEQQQRSHASSDDENTSSDWDKNPDDHDESTETSLTGVSWVLALHFFATALTLPALPSLLLEILDGTRPFLLAVQACITLQLIQN